MAHNKFCYLGHSFTRFVGTKTYTDRPLEAFVIFKCERCEATVERAASKEGAHQ